MPQTRAVAKQFKTLPLSEVQKLLQSPIHEHRLCALVLLTMQYPKASDAQKTVGWMLREMDKRVDEQLLRGFLDEHAATMSRTMHATLCN